MALKIRTSKPSPNVDNETYNLILKQYDKNRFKIFVFGNHYYFSNLNKSFRYVGYRDITFSSVMEPTIMTGATLLTVNITDAFQKILKVIENKKLINIYSNLKLEGFLDMGNKTLKITYGENDIVSYNLNKR